MVLSQQNQKAPPGAGFGKKLAKKIFGMFATGAVIAASLVTGQSVIAPEPAFAADPLQCVDGSVYLQRGSEIFHYDTETNTLGSSVASGQKDNGLGISSGGRYLYTVQSGTTNHNNRISVYDTQTGTSESFNAPSGAPSGMIRGAVNPVKRDAYKVGLITGTDGWSQTNGDMAFSASGTLIVLAEDNVYSVDGVVPETAGNVNLSTTHIVNISGTAGNGIAFGGGGYLYVSTSTHILKVDPVSKETVGSAVHTGIGNTDMGSCAFPNTLTVLKNVDGDRVLTDDQFTLQVSEGHYTGQNPDHRQNTTDGAASGLQTKRLGPEFINQGVTYKISELAAGSTNLNMYDTSMVCEEYVNPNATQPDVNGNAPMWEVTTGDEDNPQLQGVDVICTITNSSLEPLIALDKKSQMKEKKA